MYRSELIKLCDPMKPEETLQQLKQLLEALERSSSGPPQFVQAVTAAVKVFQAILPGDSGLTREQQRQRGLGQEVSERGE